VNPDDPRDPSIDDAYRATAREEPPRELDERILAAAHRAVGARPSPVRRSFAQRWRVPVAIAATVVLSATVTLMVYESDHTTPFQKREALDKLQEESASPASPPAPRTAGKPASAAQPSRGDAQTMAPRPAAGADEAGASRAPAAEGALRQSPSPDAEGPATNEAKRKTEPSPAQPAGARVPPAAQAPQSSSEERMLIEKRAAPAAAPAPAAPASPLSRERELADRPAGRGERDLAPTTSQSRLQSPDDWFVEIRRLKQAGRVDEANRLIAEFRDRFPDHPLPEDLR
jgi:hypothetical protein